MIIQEMYGHELNSKLSSNNYMLFLLSSNDIAITAYDDAIKIERALKSAIKNGHFGRPGNSNTYLHKMATTTISDLVLELEFIKMMDHNDEALLAHIKDLNKIKNSISNYLEIFVNGK
jgi:hypothetical protein